MTVSKPLMTITSLFIAGLFGGGVFLLMNMDSMAQKVAERMGTQALGVAVRMDGLNIDLQNKSATVDGLTIANPDGFDSAHALRIEKIGVSLAGFSKELLRFKDISVQGTDVNLEVRPNGTNLSAIQKGMPKTPAQAPSAAEGEGADAAQQIKVIVERFAMTKAQLRPRVVLLEDQEMAPVVVPDIVLTGIGQKENGVLAQDAITQIWTQVSKRLSATASQAGFYEGLSRDVLNDLVGSQIGGFKDKLKDGLNRVEDSLRNLF